MSRSDVLVDADWVQAHLDDPGIVLVEVDEDTSAYDKGHIRGAVRIDWKTELQDPVRRDFVDKTGFENLLSEKGIANDDLVVLYGGNNNWFAAYAYWYFRLYGHQNVKLLDGGRKKWELDSRDLVQDTPSRPKTDYTAKEQDAAIRALRDEVVDAIGDKNLVDVRSAATFRRPATFPGRRRPTTTARSAPTTSCARCTRRPASTCPSRRSPTAASASGRPTPGSPCTSCWACRT
jgi:thiosulfate/3-mercaptopyruvate sulfurtransferase